MNAMIADSVDRLGEIPAHWKISKLKYLADNIGKKNDYLGGNYIGLENIESWTGKIIFANSENFIESGLNFFDENFILFSKLRPYLAKVARPTFSGQCSTELLTILPRGIDKNFLFHLMISHGFIFEVDSSTYGTKMPRANWNFISNIKIPLPPLEEQKKIAAYLDKKCSAIDSAVDAAKKMVETLASYKKSLITETVTKGLNPSAKMIAGGVEWLGKIPAHWKISKLKYLFKIFSGTTPNTDKEYYWGGNIFWITPADFKSKNLTELGVKDYGLRLIPPNSLIFSKRAPIGEVAITSAELTINQGCLACIPKKISDTKYYYYLLSILNEPFNFFGAGTTFKEISLSNFERFSVILPPLEEQKKIADFLDKKCSAIDESISAHKNLAEKLIEYKKSLIYEVVTGKKEV